ncbi:MAG TPA: thioredoxin-disulfide reductase [Candidatus Limivivens intestinipullorum]|uniref:Thioredoxin reductase n=1 Tax=Candidatus Limivivens intestinipullorum TaxID=2840858 RepID=A0A9D1JKG6_9FIRM|nr:thioredoxin-disulfide reductase [Candidatus Limivivens intestinipullorum]
MNELYDVIIIGSGPAGLAAVIYAERARLKTLVLEKEYISGGQVVNTYDVDNYPGLPGIGGFELGMKFREHADKLGAAFETACAEHIYIEENGIKRIQTDKGDYLAKTVILATGANHKELGVPGEKELAGTGVSYCATCDGAFFKGRTVAVVGGGDVAAEDALFLARGCEKVYLIHRRDRLRAAGILRDAVIENEKIEMVWDTVITEICGDDHVEAIKTENVKTKERKVLDVDGVFIAVGMNPNSSLLQGIAKLNEQGYVVAGENCETNVTGIYAAGDVRTKELRQIITAAADGACAVTSVQNYLLKH